MSANKYEKLAANIAKNAHEQDFETRLGWDFVADDPRAVYFYDNNPHLGQPRYTRVLVDTLEEGWEVLGAGWYPLSGEQYGYTMAVVLRGPEAITQEQMLTRISEVQRVVHQKVFAAGLTD